MALIREDIGDAGVDSLTQYTLALGDVFQGTIYPVDDQDSVRVELTAGKIYEVFLSSDQSRFLLFGYGGDHRANISTYRDHDNIHLTLAPTVTGTYYLGVSTLDVIHNAELYDYEITIVEKLIPIGSYDEVADYLTDGFAEAVGDARYAFDARPGDTLTADITALNVEGQQLARWALEAWTYVTGIEFGFVDDGSAHITFDDFEPGAYTITSVSEGVIVSSHVNISTYWLNTYGTAIDSFSFTTYIHEIGHALGLGHPGPYNSFGTYGNENIFLIDSVQATVMSYFEQSDNTYINASHAYPVTPMIADIIAIQNLYGVPTSINSGNTVYGYESNADGHLGSLSAQWAAARSPFLGIYIDHFSKPELADLDGDGDPDLVIGGALGLIYYFENTGTPDNSRFTQRTGNANPLDGVDAGSNSKPALVDLDGDGDSDLVVGNADGLFHYFENTGTVTDPRFTQRIGDANPLDGVDVGSDSTPVFVDLDGDDDPDLAGGNSSGLLYFFENTGAPAKASFVRRTGDENPLGGIFETYKAAPIGIEYLHYGVSAFADIDDDGDPDLVVGYDKGDIIYYENTGTATEPGFAKRSGAALPLDGVAVDYYGAPAFADLDNDEDLDLVVGDGNGAIHYLKNTGTAANPDFSTIILTHPVTLTIYDNGGIDTLDLRTDTTDQRVDLRPEGISDVYGLVGNLIIARGTWIENFIAGSGNDRVIGNAAANYLEGNDGNDDLSGNSGNDVLEGGAGADRLDGGPGTDRVSYRSSDAGVMVNLGDKSAENGHAQGDVIVDVENVTGSSHPDVLAGDSAGNYLDGGPGNDTLRGLGGDDVLKGGAGADRLDGGAGTDWLSYAGSEAPVSVRLYDGLAERGHAEGDIISGFENLRGSAHADVLAGNGGSNRLEGGGGDDQLRGGSGDDVLDGGAGADRLDGGAGTDWLSYAGSATGVTVNLEDGAGAGGDAEGDVIADVENITGSAYDDVLSGDAGINRLTGADGDDALRGGGSDDILDGGPGEDRLNGGAGSDTAVYRNSNEAVTVNLEAGTGAGGHAEGDELADVENIEGSVYDDVLTGADGANRLDGSSGNDVLEGGAGADRLDGGAGEDWLSYAGSDGAVSVRLYDGYAGRGHAEGDTFSGFENLRGSAYADRLAGTGRANRLDGGAGNDQLRGGSGDDVLDGGAGADHLDGGAGADWLSYAGSAAGVAVNLEDGAGAGGDAEGDVIADVENIAGSDYEDTLTGDAGANRLTGADGDDALRGGGSDDILDGGPGADRLDGGTESDTVLYRHSDAAVTVNLEAGTGAGGHAEGDELADVENIEGSAYDDVLTGADGANRLDGSSGNDVLEGGAGADRLDGGAGEDWLSYAGSDGAVSVRLYDGYAGRGHAEGDIISGFENLRGSDYADILAGNSGANRLEGSAGNDQLWGGSGDDVLQGGAGADRLDGGAGEDWLSYAGSDGAVSVRLYDGLAARGHAEGDTISGFENLRGSDYADRLAGTGRANRLEGGAGNDQLRGGSGDDVLDGGPDADRLDGGAGSDTTVYRHSHAAVTVNIEAGTGAGGDAEGDELADIENIEGSIYDDVLTGAGGANRLEGGSGDDVLEGGAGADRLDGGPGSDWLSYAGSDGAVFVDLLEGMANRGHAQGDIITGIENVMGSDHNDTILGDNGANHLDGGDGDDEIRGGNGNDVIVGGNGQDWHLSGGNGNDKIWGGDGIDWMDGGDGTDELWGEDGDDTAHGGNGDDRLYGGTGNDNLSGGTGADWLEGGDGDDLLFGHPGDDVLKGGAGDDMLKTDSGADLLDGGPGLDTADYWASPLGVTVNLMEGTGKGGEAEGDVIVGIEIVRGSHRGDDVLVGDSSDNQLYGFDGNDELRGNDGDDYLDGDRGDDVLWGGGGNDVLDGGIGTDIFIFAPGHGDDIIPHFSITNADQIDLTAFDLSGFDDLSITSIANRITIDVMIDLSAHGGGTILLEDFDIANLDAGDFIF